MTSLFHIGVAVSNLDVTVEVLQSAFDFRTISRRTVEHEYIGQLIASPGTFAEIAFLDIGDSNILELIEWRNHPVSLKAKLQTSLSSPSTHHVCIYVDNADRWFHKLSNAHGVSIINNGPTLVPIGPNKGCKVFFVSVMDELYFEIFERIPDSASLK